MNKSDLKKIMAVSAVALAAAGAAAVIYKYRSAKAEGEKRAEELARANAYILGGGMSAYASALYLIRDLGLKAQNVHVYTDRKYDCGNDEEGYVARRGKIIGDNSSRNFFDLMQEVRSLDIPDLTVTDEILNIYNAKGGMRPITFIDSDDNVIDISNIRLDREHRRAVLSVLREKKENLVSVPIEERFGADFLSTNFWKLISAAYGISEDSDVYDFARAVAGVDKALSGTMPSDFDRYEEIIEPLKAHLKKSGADIVDGAYVTDVDFENGRAGAVHYNDNGVRKTVYLNENDICILPTDEMAECESRGSFNESAPKSFAEPYALWQRLAEKNSAFNNPSLLFDEYDDNMSEEFTITLSNKLLPELIDRVTCGALGQDGVIVMDNSSWKMTVCAVPPTHFKNQGDDIAVLWGYAARYDMDGDKCGKPMTDCSGAEILYELVACLNLEEAWEDICETVINVIPCHRKYDKSYIAPVSSKLEIIPTGISNMAVSGDFADGEGSVFTEEYGVTTARTAAYRLVRSRKKIYTSGRNSLAGIKKILRKGF